MKKLKKSWVLVLTFIFSYIYLIYIINYTKELGSYLLIIIGYEIIKRGFKEYIKKANTSTASLVDEFALIENQKNK